MSILFAGTLYFRYDQDISLTMPGFDNQIELFCNDRHSGSAELAQTAYLILKDAVLNDPAFSIEKLTGIAGKLIRGQPSMAAVINVINEVCLAIEENIRKPDRRWLSESLKVIGEEMVNEIHTTVEKAVELLAGLNRIATYSRSSLVESALIRSSEHNPGLKIFLSESRPGGEGITLARNLSSKRIEVTLCADAALPRLIETCDALVIGADAVMPGRFSNKTGTGSMCSAAKRINIPVYILAPRSKFLAGNLEQFYRIDNLPGGDIFGLKLDNVNICNRLFEWSDTASADVFVGGYGNISGEKTNDLLVNTGVADCLKNTDH